MNYVDMVKSLYVLKYSFQEPKNAREALETHYEGFPLRQSDYAVRFTPESIRAKYGDVRLTSEIPDEEMGEWEKQEFILQIHSSAGDLTETTKIKGYLWSPYIDFDDEIQIDVEDAIQKELYESLIAEEIGIPGNEYRLNEFMKDDELFTEAVSDYFSEFEVDGRTPDSAKLTGNGIILKTEADSDAGAKYKFREKYRFAEEFESLPWSAEEFEWCLREFFGTDEPIMIDDAKNPSVES